MRVREKAQLQRKEIGPGGLGSGGSRCALNLKDEALKSELGKTKLSLRDRGTLKFEVLLGPIIMA